MSLRNSVDFWLRQRFRWSPRAVERPESWDDLLDPREPDWIDRYRLGETRSRMTWERWRRNLSFLELLDASREAPEFASWLDAQSSIRALDIGSKNFDYVDALAAFWSRGGSRPLSLTGIEVDPNRRYLDLRTRGAWAQSYCAQVPGAEYRGENLVDHRGTYDVITWFFPFVVLRPLRAWGLPDRLFEPQRLWNHARSLVRPGGWIIVVNWNPNEVEAQRQIAGSSAWSQAVPGSFHSAAKNQWISVYGPCSLTELS